MARLYVKGYGSLIGDWYLMGECPDPIVCRISISCDTARQLLHIYSLQQLSITSSANASNAIGLKNIANIAPMIFNPIEIPVLIPCVEKKSLTATPEIWASA